MRSYTFRYIEYHSGPFKTLAAESDAEFYKMLEAFLAQSPQRRLIPGTITYRESGAVADPPLRLAA